MQDSLNWLLRYGLAVHYLTRAFADMMVEN